MLYGLMLPAVLTKFFQELNGDFASLHKMPSDGTKLQCSVMLVHILSDITPWFHKNSREPLSFL